MLSPTAEPSVDSLWHSLATTVLAGGEISRSQALSILESSDDQWLDLVGAAYRIRHQYFGKTVQLYFLMNAKSGLCPRIVITAANPKSPTPLFRNTTSSAATN